MASNIKSKPTSKESPTEPFKRAVTGCIRALARKPDLEVAFAAERPGLLGGKVRLPEPPRKLGKAEAAVVRGHADSIALRLACHDPAMHRRLQPAGQQARAVFEAVEQARVEAIGARRMDGVAQNLTAMLDERFHRGKVEEITDRADAPIEDALALMVMMPVVVELLIGEVTVTDGGVVSAAKEIWGSKTKSAEKTVPAAKIFGKTPGRNMSLVYKAKAPGLGRYAHSFI